MTELIQKEWFLGLSMGACLFYFALGSSLWSGSPVLLWASFVLLLLAITGSALSVVRHAEHLAERFGEPFGTLILTLAVTSIEVISISAVMLHGQNNPTLARDTLYAVLMIILNGMVGLSLLIGAWRHREQQYNLQGANAYLSVIIPLAVMSLVLPTFTLTTAGPTLSNAQAIFVVLVSIGLYVTFLGIQTGRHRGYFSIEGKAASLAGEPFSSPLKHVILLACYMLPVVYLAEQLAVPVDFTIETLHAPAALGGLIIAILVATPEAVGAVRAAASNHLQRSVNIFLGSVLSTIGLTVPAMVAISYLTHRQIVLGLQHADLVILLLTLTVGVVTFSSGKTNVLQGAVHCILFFAYLLLIFQG